MNKQAKQILLRFFLADKRVWFFLIMSSLAQVIALFFIVYFIHHILQSVLPNQLFTDLLVEAGSILALTMMVLLVNCYTHSFLLKNIRILCKKFRASIFEQVFHLPKSYRDLLPLPKIQHALSNETLKVEEAALAFYTDFAPSLIVSLALNFLLLTLNFRLYFVFMSTMPLLLLASFYLNRTLSHKTKQQFDQFSKFHSRIYHFLQTLDLTHTQSTDQIEKRAHKNDVDDVHEHFFSTNWFKMFYLTSQNFVVTLAGLLVLTVGGIFVIQDNLSIGSLLTFYLIIGFQKRYLTSLASSYEKILEGWHALQQLSTTLTSHKPKPYVGKKEISFNGKIVIDSISFGWSEEDFIQSFSLVIKPETITTITGPNGSGKTTLIHLILGFYRPTEGELYASDHPYDLIDLKKLRREIGVVSQSPIIRSGSILENIVYGHPNYKKEELEMALYFSSLDQILSHMPNGLDSQVGELGEFLSGGEKQRIALARALIHKPKLLILDEPTNHLDTISSNHLLNELEALPFSPAILAITHNEELVKLSKETKSFKGRLLYETVSI